MFGKGRKPLGSPDVSNDRDDSSDELLDLAEAAAARGNGYEAAHLYLAAFEASALSDNTLVQPAIDGLYKAWDISHELKDRSLAEHVFERLEPYLSSEEVASHAEALQRLALDKLEEFGLSRKDIQDMAQMVSEDFAGIKDGMVVGQVFARSLPAAPSQSKPSTGVVPWPQESQDQVAKEDDDAREQVDPDEFTYDDLVGFDRAIESMHMRGIGLANDSEFSEFVASLSRRHGIDSLSSFETMLFRSASREDANQFMLATGKELGVPGLRMYMDQTPMGFPILCVVATNDFRINATRGFSGPGMLLLEDVDLWGAPFTNDFDEDDEYPYGMQFSRGAREAVMFIRSAVDNPEVKVIATCSLDSDLDDFFEDLLGPLTSFTIELPNEEERSSLWNDVFSLYPSLRALGSDDLVRLSANLSRHEIYFAAREAVESAFRHSIERRIYVPVTRNDLYDRIASFQPMNSDEYRELEDCLVEELRLELDDEDVLKGLG